MAIKLKFIVRVTPGLNFRVEFFQELDRRDKVFGYYRFPSSRKIEGVKEAGLPVLSKKQYQKFAGMCVGEIRKVGNLSLRRWC